MWEEEREELRLLHTKIVMIRHGAFEMEKQKGGFGWFGRCKRCIKDRWLQTAHLLPVGQFPSMRYETDNATPLCTGCHIFWWHKHPLEAADWAKEVFGSDKMDELRERGLQSQKMHFGAIRMALQAELAELMARAVTPARV